MMRLADRGGGNYYYIRDAHGIVHAFGRELRSLSGVGAHRPELRLELAPRVRVRAVHGYEFEQRGREVRVKLSDLSGGARRKVVMSLAVPTDRPGPLPLADVALAFEKPGGGRDGVTARVAAEVTPDARRAEGSVDRKAIAEATQAEAGVVLKRAITRSERGDAAGAAREIEAAQEAVRERARRYNFSDESIRGALRGALGGVRAAPPPSAASGSHLRKSGKERASTLAR
jgi:hypothetical protein